MNISVIGLGKLGSPIVAVAASKGFQVIGVDTNPDYAAKVAQGIAPVFEPGLADLLVAYKDRIRTTQDIGEAVRASELTLIIVPTPSTPQGDFTIEYVRKVVESIAIELKNKTTFHVVAVCSTVMPGDTDERIIPLMEEVSGKTCGVDFGVCYNPEFIALGSVIKDLQYPDFVLIGQSDIKAGDIMESFYRTFTSNDPPFRRMRIVNAELTKISINSFVTNKISFANLITEMCDTLPGGNVDEVTQAMGLDSRIGAKYFRGGVGFGGPCFPRDNRAVAYAYERIGVKNHLALATDQVNAAHTAYLAKKIIGLTEEQDEVVILGASYKPDTNVIEESQSLALARLLLEGGRRVTIYDPAANESVARALPMVQIASSLQAGLKDKQLICLMTPWPEFRQLDPAWITSTSGTPVLVDCWRLLDASKFANVAKYYAFGVHTT